MQRVEVELETGPVAFEGRLLSEVGNMDGSATAYLTANEQIAIVSQLRGHDEATLDVYEELEAARGKALEDLLAKAAAELGVPWVTELDI